MDFDPVVIAGAVAIGTCFIFSWLKLGKESPKKIPAEEVAQPQTSKVSGDFTIEELAAYDGNDPSKPILIGVKGRIFDMTKGADFYGPGGPYAKFAGKDATAALAKMKVDEGLCNLKDPVADLTASERDTLDEWEQKFEGKYPLVGKVVSSKSQL
ncbi:hypothetical protein CYMTET_33413 [Cymbomonas tetramitiformis]|uniref:Cytochrome b5 heme-binding domain-containing protein n=1 Tax=Cymbomonas tetramitiformis TaxID=36881 RepID=A0AAE0FD77_9CHLO|nr:hypothetical protein CYMTET_33413 [Cymbomonas tetramitiformis]|eukprot:gene8293-9850_t